MKMSGADAGVDSRLSASRMSVIVCRRMSAEECEAERNATVPAARGRLPNRKERAMDERVNRITAEIAAVVERNLRRELLREREAALEMELETVRSELGRLSGAGEVRPALPKPATGSPKPAPRPAGGRPMQAGSARDLMIRALRRAGHPMTIRELTTAIARSGWKSGRKDPSKTVDVALRNNPQDFRRTAPSTFALNR